MRHVYVRLDEDIFSRLIDAAVSERRRPRDQAALLIERGLPGTGAETPDQEVPHEPVRA